jgi:hypothetical protein
MAKLKWSVMYGGSLREAVAPDGSVMRISRRDATWTSDRFYRVELLNLGKTKVLGVASTLKEARSIAEEVAL